MSRTVNKSSKERSFFLVCLHQVLSVCLLNDLCTFIGKSTFNKAFTKLKPKRETRFCLKQQKAGRQQRDKCSYSEG